MFGIDSYQSTLATLIVDLCGFPKWRGKLTKRTCDLEEFDGEAIHLAIASTSSIKEARSSPLAQIVQ